MTKIDVLEERVNNHIKFFWVTVGTILAALGSIAYVLFAMNGHLSRLDGLESQETRLALRSQAALPQPVFETALPELRTTLVMARQENVKAPPAVMETLKRKLLASNPESPDFWPAAATFVSYRSASTFPEESKRLLAQNLPNCTDAPPAPPSVTAVHGSSFSLSVGLYQNCRVKLDSATDDERLNQYLKTANPAISFRHCLVEYAGGPVNLILAWDHMQFQVTVHNSQGKGKGQILAEFSGPAIQFHDCVFQISFQNTPPPNGQQLTANLLAQDVSSVSFPVAR